MSAYFGVTVGFVVLSIYVFLLFRWWHRRLTSLAARYDLAERRKRGSRESLLVMLLFAVPALAVLLGSMVHRSVSGVFIVTLFILSLAPAVIWYIRRLPSLRALGFYGGQP
jgi:hypothetical protein